VNIAEVARSVKMKLLEGNKVFDQLLEEIEIENQDQVAPLVKLYRLVR
jgi:hypothetical protein